MSLPRLFALLLADVQRANPLASPLLYSQDVHLSSGPIPMFPAGSPPTERDIPPVAWRREEGPLRITEAPTADVTDADPAGVLEIFLPVLRKGMSEEGLRRMGIEPPWPLCPHHLQPQPVMTLGAVRDDAFWICDQDPAHQIAVGSLGL